MSVANFINTVADVILAVFKVIYRKSNVLCNLVHILSVKASCCNGRSTETQAACDKRTARLVGNGVLVSRDINLVKSVFKLLTRDLAATKVNKAKMVVASA